MYTSKVITSIFLVISLQNVHAVTWGEYLWNAAFGSTVVQDGRMVPVEHPEHVKLFRGQWVAFSKQNSDGFKAVDFNNYYTIFTSFAQQYRVALIQFEPEKWGDDKEEGCNMIVAVRPEYVATSYALTASFFKTNKLAMRALTDSECSVLHDSFDAKLVKVATLVIPEDRVNSMGVESWSCKEQQLSKAEMFSRTI